MRDNSRIFLMRIAGVAISFTNYFQLIDCHPVSLVCRPRCRFARRCSDFLRQISQQRSIRVFVVKGRWWVISESVPKNNAGQLLGVVASVVVIRQ